MERAAVVRPRGQLPIFAAASSDPAPGDLAGLLIGPGQVVRMGGTARVSVVVDAPWRVHALDAELRLRGLGMQWEPSSVEGHFGVRTSYSGVLSPLSSLWLRGAVKAPPAGFLLDGVRLRLWFTAAGTADPDGAEVLLRLGASDEQCWTPAARSLAVLGFPAELTRWRESARPGDDEGGGPRPAQPALRISGRRRLRRFAELIGDALDVTPAGFWPG
ncbi:MAG: hypothetical protein HOV79_33530 [Hamadaea sp.]|nr:hypothetical protein [Hamadaea sp.]